MLNKEIGEHQRVQQLKKSELEMHKRQYKRLEQDKKDVVNLAEARENYKKVSLENEILQEMLKSLRSEMSALKAKKMVASQSNPPRNNSRFRAGGRQETSRNTYGLSPDQQPKMKSTKDSRERSIELPDIS